MLTRLTVRWRRSLQLRVVTTTLVVSGVVVVLLATLLLDQVGRGLISAKTRAALTQTQTGLAQAQDAVAVGDTRASAVEARLQDVAQVLSQRGESGTPYRILLVSEQGDAKAFASEGLALSALPAELDAALDAGDPVAYLFLPDLDDGTLVVGSTLVTPLEPYRLYYFFALDSERRTLGLVRRTAAAAGLLLVLLLALIAGLVARQVVQPVRLAARTADRLAHGLLEERMLVRGEDDIARLAVTFNSMAEALQTQIRQLEDLSRVQRRFVADVTHELRTPLTTVRMAADLLYDTRHSFPPATHRSAELLHAELERFESLLSELLEISRYDAGAASLETEQVDLVPLVGNLVSQVQPLSDRQGSVVTLRATGPVVAEVDSPRLERIVRNLLVNALEHGEGRPVEVEVVAGDSCVCIRVRDHGVGLKHGEEGLVFTRFWRGDPSRARTTGGTGLGLAIALEDARLHGGTLEAWGDPDIGAAFLLTLPTTPGTPMGEPPVSVGPPALTR